jgi:hypothetical protein
MAIDWNSELDKVEEANKPITPGVHNVTITQATTTNSSTGNQMINLVTRVEGGADDGKIAYPRIVFAFENPRAMRMTMRRLANLGISEQMLRVEGLSIEQIAGRLIGRTVRGTVTHETYQGEVQNRVDFLDNNGPATPAGVPNVSAPVPPTAPTVATLPPTPSGETPPIPTIPTGDEEPF